MNERQINRQLRREFRGPAWALLAYFGLMNVLVMVDMIALAMEQALDAAALGTEFLEPDMDSIMGSAWGYLAAVAVGLLVLYAGKGRAFWRDQVFHKSGTMKFGTFLAFLAIAMGVQLLNGLWITALEAVMNLFGGTALGMLEAVSGASDTPSMFIYASLVAPVAEELIFRGYIQRSLERYGKRFAIIGSAFLFGIFHGNLLQTPYAFLMGLVFGYLTAQYHIGWAMGLHLFNNLVLADLLTRVTAGLSEELVTAIDLVLLGGSAVVSIVMLIVKREKIRDYFRREWVDSRCLRCFFSNSGVIVMTVLMAINALFALTV